MSVNDVTSGILAPALNVKRLQKREPNQKQWWRSQANKNRCVCIFKRRDIIFNRLHFPILIKFMLCDTSETNTVHVFSFVALSFNPCILENPKRALLQTVKSQMKFSIMLHFIRVFTVCVGLTNIQGQKYIVI